MKAYEYLAEVLPDGHLSMPESIKKVLKPDSRLRVILMLEDEEAQWNKMATNQFLKGYADKDAAYDNL
jgi:predicted nucleotidyltransferase